GVKNVVLFHVRQNQEEGATRDAPLSWVPVHAREVGGGERLVGVVIVMDGQDDLVEVVFALRDGGGLADLLHGRQQHADEDGDDGDHHQQLDQREAGPAPTTMRTHGFTLS